MNNSALSVFDFKSKEVRVLNIDSKPWFIAKDICSILEIKNVSEALSRLDRDEKDLILTESLGGKQETNIISESGMYTLVLTSRKPEAKPFRKWVTSEVLPSIRETGKYIAPANLAEEPKPLILPPADVRVSNLANALDFLGIDATNPRWSSGIKDLVIDILGVTQPILLTNEKWRGVVEIAIELGFNQAHKLDVRSNLGKYISKQAKKLNLERKQEERLCNGTNRLIWLYKETPELLDLITNYFTEV